MFVILLADSDFETGSPCLIRDEICVEDDYKQFPTSSSAENVAENEGVQSWTSEDFVSGPFVHKPPECEDSTDDTDSKGKEQRQKGPTNKMRKVVLPTECVANIATDVESPTMFTDDSGQYKTKHKKRKCTKINRKTNIKPSYNSLMKNYIHLAQTEKETEMSQRVTHRAEQPTAVKPVSIVFAALRQCCNPTQ